MATAPHDVLATHKSALEHESICCSDAIRRGWRVPMAKKSIFGVGACGGRCKVFTFAYKLGKHTQINLSDDHPHCIFSYYGDTTMSIGVICSMLVTMKPCPAPLPSQIPTLSHSCSAYGNSYRISFWPLCILSRWKSNNCHCWFERLFMCSQ